MNNTNEPVGSTPGLSTLMRARFGPGMLLQHEDLEQLNTYTRELSRLLFQSFFGCGVICGLVVEAVPECEKLKVSVQPGVALSCSGEPVYVPGPKATEVFTKPSFDITTASKLWVVLCGTTRCCAPRTTTCSSDDDEATSDCTREKDGFEIRLMLDRPKCACGCPERDAATPPPVRQQNDNKPDCKCVTDFTCHEAHYAGLCGCTCGDCSGCDCKCILLARLEHDVAGKAWKTDHSVRRFIRPVLMRDPKVEDEAKLLAGQQQPQPAEMQQLLEPQQLQPPQTLEEVRQERLRLQAEERRLLREQKQSQQQEVAAAAGKSGPK